MKVIWKFELIGAQCFVSMPAGAEVLNVDHQNGQVVLWAMVDPEARTHQRKFDIVGTGLAVDDLFMEDREYIGTAQIPPNNPMAFSALVLHVFEDLCKDWAAPKGWSK
jgi:hypothetical protein